MEEPLSVKEKIAVGAGVYTDITNIDAPAEATPGEQVIVQVTIKNLYHGSIGIRVGGALDYGVTPWPTVEFPSGDWANVPAGATVTFSGVFTMPDKNVSLHAYSYFYSEGWYFDDDESVIIRAVGVEPQFSNLSVSYRRLP